jgi:uncharacterized membrane protein
MSGSDPRAGGRNVGTHGSDGHTSGRLEALMALVLRGGVTVAAVLLAIGLPWNIFGTVSPEGSEPSVGEALRQLPALRPVTISALGVVVLVAIPVLQLLTSVVLFARQRDRLFLGLTLTICVIVAVGAVTAGIAVA